MSTVYNYYKDDHAHVDDVQSVTISPRNPLSADITGVYAKLYGFSVLDQARAASNLELTEDDALFTVWDDELGGHLLKADDLITHDSVTYRITRANRLTFTAQWQIVARKQRT